MPPLPRLELRLELPRPQLLHPQLPRLDLPGMELPGMECRRVALLEQPALLQILVVV